MIIALLNQKGGVGKTTLALHLAGQWAKQSKRTILIDADPQGSALDWSEQRAGEGLQRLSASLALHGIRFTRMLMPMIEARRAESKPAAAFDLFAWLRSALFVPRGDFAPRTNQVPVRSPADQPPIVRRVVDLSALAPRSDGLFVRLAERAGSQ